MRNEAVMRCLMTCLILLFPGLAFAQGNPSFNLVNRSGQAINEVYATPAGVDRWGRDRLARNFLPPSQTFPVQLPADGNCIYDVRVVYADGKAEEGRRLNVCQIESVAFPGARMAGGPPGQRVAPGTAPGSAPGSSSGGTATDDPSFRLVNRGRRDVYELYASPTGNENWGRDRLGDDTVAAGATRVVRLPRGECQWDVRVVFDGGEAMERRRVNLCTITDFRVP